MVGSVFARFVVDNSYMGRKFSIVAMSTAAVFFSLILASTLELFYVWIFLLTLAVQILTVSVTIITSEIYSTHIRVTAHGFARAVSRLTSTLMPPLSLWAMSYGTTKPFLLVVPVFAAAGFLVYRNLTETKGGRLDDELAKPLAPLMY